MRVLNGQARLPIITTLRFGGSVLLSQEATQNCIDKPGYLVPAMGFGKPDGFVDGAGDKAAFHIPTFA